MDGMVCGVPDSEMLFTELAAGEMMELGEVSGPGPVVEALAAEPLGLVVLFAGISSENLQYSSLAHSNLAVRSAHTRIIDNRIPCTNG